MNNYVESQTRICKAYIFDCYVQLAMVYNTCKAADRKALHKNISTMLDRVKTLLDGNASNKEPETDSFKGMNWFADKVNI